MPDATRAIAEPYRLAEMISHCKAADAGESLEEVHNRFLGGREDYIAVLDGSNLLGLCSRRQIADLLGTRYGFAIYARHPVSNYLRPNALIVREGDRLTDVLQAVFSRVPHEFFDDVLLVDQGNRFLGLIAAETLAKAQTRLLREHVREVELRKAEIEARNAQMEQDLLTARELQMALLPRAYPRFSTPADAARDALAFVHRYRPSGTVGGDLFHILPISETATGLFICDVMGHEIRSALIGAMLRALVEEARDRRAHPGSLLGHLNRELRRLLDQIGDTVFATAFYLVVDLEARLLRFACAGHPPPFLLSAEGAPAFLRGPMPAQGPALGILADAAYTEQQQALFGGERIVLYTDGLIEAQDHDGQEVGGERVLAWMDDFKAESLECMLDRALERVGETCGGRPPDDDLCLLAVEIAADQNG